ncbi:MAG: helix-hairpin-helix domain-containing protein [Candidatus Omnitrophica bacterium]|nr:helix-hairpin-helix domain-containing protein [Candidatus Omnitrophota bacterium]
MPNFTQEEKKVILFILAIGFLGVFINFLAKLNFPIRKIISPQVSLARLNLNKISLEDLLKTRCLPQKTAQLIIVYRLEHGAFANLDSLKEVKGIGEKRFEKLKGIFFVE